MSPYSRKALVVASLLLAALAPVHGATAQTSVAVATGAIARARTEGPRLVRARRAGSAILVDGKLDDVAWRSADLATDFVQQRPTPGAPATLQTEARALRSQLN